MSSLGYDPARPIRLLPLQMYKVVSRVGSSVLSTFWTLLVFIIVGPAIGELVWLVCATYTSSGAFPVPLGFGPWWEEVIAACVVLFMGLPVAYSFWVFALACGFVMGAAKVMTRRAGMQVLTVTLAGVFAGSIGVWPAHGGRYRGTEWMDVAFVVSSIVAALCCGWLTMTRPRPERW